MTIQRLADLLQRLDLEPTEEDILDMLWLAPHIGAPSLAPEHPIDDQEAPDPTHLPEQRPVNPQGRPSGRENDVAAGQPTLHPSVPPAAHLTHSLHLRSVGGPDAATGERATELRAPAAPALPGQLELTRALRPFKRKAASRNRLLLDEEATATRVAEERLWVPALRPAPTRWLELALVVDGHESMSIWQPAIGELRRLLERLGAFSDVRFWVLDQSEHDPSWLGVRTWRAQSPLRSPRELIDPAGRRVIVVISDCLGPWWQSQSAHRVLAQWAARGPVAIFQPLPQRLWSYSRIQPVPVRLHAFQAGVPNARLECSFPLGTARRPGKTAVPVPVLEIDAAWLASWARLISAAGTAGVNAMALFVGDDRDPASNEAAPDVQLLQPVDRVRRFRASASPEAFRLAQCLAAAPISLPVIRLVQEVMLGISKQSQQAEVLLGGLLYRLGSEYTDPDDLQYDFFPGVRDILLGPLHRGDALRVLQEVSDFVGARFGQARDFRALLAGTVIASDYLIGSDSRPFALVAEHVLRLLGGHYIETANRLAMALDESDSRAPADLLEFSATPQEESPPPASAVSQKASSAGGEDDAFAGALAQVSLSDRRSRQRPLVCPYCYHAFAERDIPFRCSGRTGMTGTPCPRRIDTTLEATMGRSALLPPVFVADGRKDEAVCPACHWPTRTRVCEGCHSHLPATFRAVQGRLIALVGPSQAGKTAFMTVLIHELRHQAGERLQSSTIGADDTTQERFTLDYEWPLYKKSILFDRTTTTGKDYVPPLVFRFTMDRRTRFRLHPQELLLSFADSAGEDLVSPTKISLMARYLAAADGVMVLIDPLQFEHIRDLLDPGTPLPARAQPQEEPIAALDRITRLLLAGSDGNRIEKPVAIVLTKLDMLSHLLPDDSALRMPWPEGTFFDRLDSVAVQAQVGELLERWGAPDIDRILRQNYSRSRYFAVSALGTVPTPDNRIGTQGIQPYRVTDPFLWMLNQFGLIRS